jgi:hypothetical protein
VSQANEVDRWTLTVSASGTIIIDVLAYESHGPGGKWSPTDYFGDGADNNRLVANIYLFRNDGTVVDSTTGADYYNGMYPGEKRPGAHYATSAKNPYLTLSISPGTYILAIGSYPISSATEAFAGVNNDGSNWTNFDTNPAPGGTVLYNKYKITITLTP